MESVTDMVADCSVAQLMAMQAASEPDKIGALGVLPTYRLATLHDELHLTTAFSRMLRELEPLGHDVLPTCHNVDLLYDHYFLPALTRGEHGLVLALCEGECIGAVFTAPEQSVLNVPAGRAVDWGCYVVPEHRRQGVATRLREVALRSLKRAGLKQVVTNILTRNKAGMASYDSMGAKLLAHTYTINLQELD